MSVRHSKVCFYSCTSNQTQSQKCSPTDKGLSQGHMRISCEDSYFAQYVWREWFNVSIHSFTGSLIPLFILFFVVCRCTESFRNWACECFVTESLFLQQLFTLASWSWWENNHQTVANKGIVGKNLQFGLNLLFTPWTLTPYTRRRCLCEIWLIKLADSKNDWEKEKTRKQHVCNVY